MTEQIIGFVLIVCGGALILTGWPPYNPLVYGGGVLIIILGSVFVGMGLARIERNDP